MSWINIKWIKMAIANKSIMEICFEFLSYGHNHQWPIIPNITSNFSIDFQWNMKKKKNSLLDSIENKAQRNL